MAGIMLTVLGILTLLAGWFYLMQPAMIFLPASVLEETPADWGLAYEEVWLDTSDGEKLHGWFIPHAGARQVLLFFHGNAGNISHRQASVEIFHRTGLSVLIFDYRGYGRSNGRPTESGLYTDAAAAWTYLTDHRGFDSRDILLFGRSLGGAVAAQLASQVEPGALILESTFSSARDVARTIYPVLSWLIIKRFDFDTAGWLQSVHCPVLVLHSPDDEIIPFELGSKVYESAPTPKVFQKMRGDHNNGFLLSQPQYQQALAAFLAEYVPP